MDSTIIVYSDGSPTRFVNFSFLTSYYTRIFQNFSRLYKGP